MNLYVNSGKAETDLMIKSALRNITTDERCLAICKWDKKIPTDAAYVVVIYTTDDYLTSSVHASLAESFETAYGSVKYPISISELIRAVHEVISVQNTAKPGFTFDRKNRTVTQNGESVTLSEKEAALFDELTSSMGTPLSREELRLRLWKDTDGTNAPDVYISYLRRKLTPLLGEGFIVNVRGAGYMLRE